MRKRPIIREHPPLIRRVTRRVRFGEVDQIQFMWHGNYASWFEDGRDDMGNHFGITYYDFYFSNVVIPLKSFSLDFIAPLRYNQTYIIESSLLWNEAALLEFEYRILDQDDNCHTKGHTIQLMLDLKENLLLEQPEFYKEFCKRWSQGLLVC